MPVPRPLALWGFNAVSRGKKSVISAHGFCVLLVFTSLLLAFSLGLSHYCEFPNRLMVICILIPFCITLHLLFNLYILSGDSIPQPFFPTLHLHPGFSLVRWTAELPNADGGEVVLFM